MRSEFDFIRNIKKKYGLSQIGDDCAVLPKDSKTDLVITADLLVEDIDFRLEWTKPEYLGHKALAVSLSDIAAMGAKPLWSMLAVGVPEKIWRTKFLDRFYDGWHKLARSCRVELIGGDVSRTPDKIVVDSIVIGQVPRRKAVMRSGARVGDSIFVTGSLGGAAAGLSILGTEVSIGKATRQQRRFVERQLRPTPRRLEGISIQRRGLATSMIDISDGLAADLYHLCDESKVGARIELDAIPVDDSLKGSDRSAITRFVLAGGEDFELLFTSKKKNISRIGSTTVTRIGEVTSNVGNVEMIVGERVVNLPRSGYQHF
jgi:thiamine-monophosphate kinase